jgi:hypothetical protein
MEYSARRFLRSKLLKPIFLAGCMFSPDLLPAQNLTVIGGTSAQRQLASCFEQLAAEDLNRLPGTDHSITIVILEHQRFMEVKNLAPIGQSSLSPIWRQGGCICLRTCSRTWTTPCAAFPMN